MFIIFINDIASRSALRIHQALFADDIAAWPSQLAPRLLRSQYKELRLFLHFISDWSKRWLLDFSVSKSALVVFSHKLYAPPPPKPELVLRSKPLPQPSC